MIMEHVFVCIVCVFARVCSASATRIYNGTNITNDNRTKRMLSSIIRCDLNEHVCDIILFHRWILFVKSFAHSTHRIM